MRIAWIAAVVLLGGCGGSEPLRWVNQPCADGACHEGLECFTESRASVGPVCLLRAPNQGAPVPMGCPEGSGTVAWGGASAGDVTWLSPYFCVPSCAADADCSWGAKCTNSLCLPTG